MSRPRVQFGLRALFVTMTLCAMYFGWRLRQSNDERVAAAIQAAGGRAYFAFEHPTPSATYFSVAMLPGHTYFSQVQVDLAADAVVSRPTLVEQICGTRTEGAITAVQISLDQMTPEMIAHLKSLSQLRWIVLNMPSGMVADDSPEGRRLADLQAEFPGLIWPAYNPPGY